VIVFLCALALFATPVGWRLILYPADTLFHQSTGLGSVAEWLPPDLGAGRTLAMVAAILSIPLICVLRRTELFLSDLIMVSAAFWLASQHVRMMFVFGIVIGRLFCRLLGSEWKPPAKRAHPILDCMLILAGAAVAILSIPSSRNLEEQVARDSPVEA